MTDRYTWPNDRTVIGTLKHSKVVVVQGPLGSGKTCLLEKFRQVGLKLGWEVGTVNKQHDSLVRVLKSLAEDMEAIHFKKALEKYLKEFQQVDKDKWIEVILTVAPSLLTSSVQAAQIVNAPTPLIIALTVGSAVLTQEVLKAAVEEIRSRKKGWGEVLTKQPLDYLCKQLELDLCLDRDDTHTVFLIDDFEQLSSLLENCLPSLIEASRNTTWAIAIWGEVPNWLKTDDTITWRTGAFGISELQEIESSLTSIEMTKLQGPPVFGLPILVYKGLRELQGMMTHRGVWWPLIEHLEKWLEFQFGNKVDEILRNLRHCSVARYLDESLIDVLTGDANIWKWLYKSPLLKRRSIAGVGRSVLEFQLRSVLAHDLYRQNEQEYYDLHSRMKEYYMKEFDPARWHHRVETWYHDWCVLSPRETLRRALREVLRTGDEQDQDSFKDIGQVLQDIGIEREETRYLRRPGRSIIEAGDALWSQLPVWKNALAFYETVHREVLDLLDEKSQAEAWFGLGMGRKEIEEYGEAKEAFEKCLEIFPDDEEAQEQLDRVTERLIMKLPRSFKLARYRFTLVADEPIHLPRHPGTTLRGGFGHALRKMACYRARAECRQCPLSDTCVYAYLFRTAPPEDADVLSTLTAVARPFVVEPPLAHKSHYAPGDSFTFHLTLVGKALDYLSYVVVAFQELGRAGLGRGQGRFRLTRVATVHPLDGGAEVVFDADRPDRIRNNALTVDRAALEAKAAELPPDRLTVRFLTPTRLKHERQYVRKGPPFHVLIRRLIDRVSSLAYFHCGQRWEIDFRAWIERAKDVQIAEAATTWADWERYSGRQDQRVKMGGLVGAVTYAGDVAPYRALLALGTLVHVGKGAVMGNGRLAVKELDKILQT